MTLKETCNKTKYNTWLAAKHALLRCLKRKNGKRNEHNIYRCRCGYWHLTSQKKSRRHHIQ
ncbi:MAG: hypothetical protein LLG40_11315 [Deltaproteobacteria bacterium]|nr:hypothetical protein [Deltaproteobacteria bacterium]